MEGRGRKRDHNTRNECRSVRFCFFEITAPPLLLRRWGHVLCAAAKSATRQSFLQGRPLNVRCVVHTLMCKYCNKYTLLCTHIIRLDDSE